MSAFEYSGASACPPAKSRWARRVRFSTSPRMFNTHGVCDGSLQPTRPSVVASAAVRVRKFRRLVVTSAIPVLRLDRITTGDHRAQIVPGAGQDHHDDVHEEECDERKRAEEMDGTRALSPAEDPGQEWEGAVHRRRHGETGENDQRTEH